MRIRPHSFVLVTMLAAALLSGCTTGGANSGGGLFSRAASPSSKYIAALQGGMVGRSGLKLSDSDRQRALEAEYRALESAGVGQPVPWAGSGVTGQVVAAAPYQVGSQNCRQYTHTLTVGGRETKLRGAGCRNDDGSWTPLT
ncbi:RT0821/Lpp0805 family surface protein [Rhizobium sp. SSA_523]|uniref:RT0821/Lpp0805 family surface protein n=1 Tax=Rhizobium sp. SSA_523 TaxID=2952477 RepID=UPI0020909894|nr:RT0821/Lpp0805 family surface protein [Rhizobium sp. SSA_523]MCO5730893.1 RT0821/Lpp0805 family surface protein [Rhizobium sp. SSA_523]WKC24291.1 RT0821/Lpp0805 family surface protein [Rhizobium sp. SSA_523]